MRAPYQFKTKGKRNGPPPGLINALFLSFVYGYFAMHFNGDPLECWANDTSENAIQEEDREGMKEIKRDVKQKQDYASKYPILMGVNYMVSNT